MEPLLEIKTPYRGLIEDVTKLMANVTEQQIADIVEIFRGVIQSNRVISYIKDINDLISILEARNVLYSQNVEALLRISRTVNCAKAIGLIETYKSYKPDILRLPPNERRRIVKPKEEIIEKVFQLVSSSIGNDRRNLARELGVKDYEINTQISPSTDCNNQSAAIEMLRLFRKKRPNSDQDSVVHELITALRTLHRQSLAESVQEIVAKSRRQ